MKRLLILLANWRTLLHRKLATFLLLFLHKLLKAFTDWFIVEALELGDDLGQLLVVGKFFGERVLLEVDVGQARHPSQVLDLLLDTRDVIPLAVQNRQILAQ